MSNMHPDSLIIRIRIALAKLIDPYPPNDKAWCMHCQLMGGISLVFPAETIRSHIDLHVRTYGPDSWMSIRGSESKK